LALAHFSTFLLLFVLPALLILNWYIDFNPYIIFYIIIPLHCCYIVIFRLFTEQKVGFSLNSFEEGIDEYYEYLEKMRIDYDELPPNLHWLVSVQRHFAMFWSNYLLALIIYGFLIFIALLILE